VVAFHKVWKPNAKQQKKPVWRVRSFRLISYSKLCAVHWFDKLTIVISHSVDFRGNAVVFHCARFKRGEQRIQLLWPDNIWIQSGGIVFYVQDHRHEDVNFANHTIGRTCDVYTYERLNTSLRRSCEIACNI
jgi:hypothetical protein